MPAVAATVGCRVGGDVSQIDRRYGIAWHRYGASSELSFVEIDTLVAVYRSQAEAAGLAPQYTGIEDGPPSKRVKMEDE
jgi:hypothetical protein